MSKLTKFRRTRILVLILLVISTLLGLMFLVSRNNSFAPLMNEKNKEGSNSSQKVSGFFSFLLIPEEVSSPASSIDLGFPTPTITPTPTPKPLTFSEMNSLYGPCIHLPVLMYHHVQSPEQAKANNSLSLTVFTEIFNQQMEYLRNQSYSVVSMSDLVSFFDQGTPLPSKPILITFDDGYADFASDAWPILKNYGFKATVFLPTGLVENPGYLKWNQIQEIANSGLIFFANHTWSHHNVETTKEVVEREIGLADTQLEDHQLNYPKVFSYPYGLAGVLSKMVLTEKGYSLAFTTKSGSTLCLKKQLELPRIRIGNTSLKTYGL